ncbi:MAG TPA: bifunctional helix-turn-helix transcriptional regulator/GNAT family N-acetyltransferase [Gemmatimonadaceae bacterium]|nr:bifunctional helix-turn-helix transcriptional regulator/GNAT family N-acetyltransferase [Gemmatimonadaceae bacterium]
MPASSRAVAAVRRFNRFFTRRIGALDEGHLGSRFSLTEVRVLYEIAHGGETTAAGLVRRLGVDEGYVSRMLQRFGRLGLVRRTPSRTDRRVASLSLTPRGAAAFRPLDSRADQAIRELLSPLDPAAQATVVTAMGRIERAFGVRQESPVRLRTHRPGDIGWIVHRHGALYAAEYGYDERFEAIVAKVAGDFLEHFDPKHERCWLAERDGEILGSIMLVKKSASVAKLRLLYLEPDARGLGLGRRLVDECIAFARAAGYRKITLWTQSSLAAARHIYKATGFRLVSSKSHADFGPREKAETWELRLNP